MGRGLAAVAHDVGLLLFVPALMASVSVPVALVMGDHHAVVPLLVTAGVSAVVGLALVRGFRHARTTSGWPAVEIVALGWLLVGLVSAGAFWGIAAAGTSDGQLADVAFLDPWNAVFEGLSGITSTGLTMVGGRESDLSPILQWWRSLLQWVGAVGVVLFALGFAQTASGVRTLYEAEGRSDDLAPSIGSSVRRTWAVYLGLTAAAVLALAATDHTPWEAINHGLTAMSTGGFSITDDSIGGYATTTKLLVALLMAIGAISFVGHYVLLVERDVRQWWQLTPVRAQAVVLVAGGAVAVALPGTRDVALVDRVFQWISASATAGLSTVPQLSTWSTPVLVLLILGMAIGAPSGSTGGGIKLDRAVWLAKGLAVRAMSGRHTVTWDSEQVEPSTRARAVERAAAIVGLWATTLAIGVALMVALTDAPVRDVAFEVTSALSNVGLDTGVVDPGLNAAAKATFAVLMYLGRLELLVALTLASQREHA